MGLKKIEITSELFEISDERLTELKLSGAEVVEVAPNSYSITHSSEDPLPIYIDPNVIIYGATGSIWRDGGLPAIITAHGDMEWYDSSTLIASCNADDDEITVY